MALALQRKTFPLGVTQNESAARELLSADAGLRSQRNARFLKAGRVDKRLGYQTLNYQVLSGGNLSAGKRLFTRHAGGEELLLADKKWLYSYSAAAGRWVTRDRLPNALVTTERVAGDHTGGNLDRVSVAVSGNYLCVAYQDLSATGTIYARVFDATSRALLSETQITTDGAIPHVVTVGAYFFVVFVRVSVGSIRFRRFDTAAPASGWGAETDILTNTTAGASNWDVYPAAASFFVLDLRSTGELDLRRCSNTGAVTHSSLDIRAGKVVQSPSVWQNNAGRVFIAYRNVTDTAIESWGFAETNLTTIFSNVVLASPVAAVVRTTIGPKRSGVAYVLWWLAASAATPPTTQSVLAWVGIDAAGTVDIISHETRNVTMASRPFAYDTETYMLLITAAGQDDQLGLVLVDLGNDYATATYRARPLAVWAGGDLFMTAAGQFIAEPTAAGGGAFFLFPYGIKDAEQAGASRGSAIELASVQIDDVGTFTRWSSYVETNGTLVIAAGLPWVYDGERVSEGAFTFYPFSVYDRAVAGGTLVDTHVYQWRVCYAWRDAAGNVRRSAPSAVVQRTIAAANQKVELYVPHYTVTAMVDSDVAFTHAVGVELYRRDVTAGGDDGAFVRVKSVATGTPLAVTPSDPTAANFLTLTDDGTIDAQQPNLYTTAGVLEALPPAPLTGVVLYDGRIFGHDQRRLYYTREVLPGEGTAWHPDLAIDVSDTLDLRALAPMDAYLLILRARGIDWMQGTGPDDRNVGVAYSDVRSVPSGVGCIDPRSVLVWHEGVCFRSPTGIMLLDRGLRITEFGKPVEDTLAAFPGSSDAVLVPGERELRFSVYDPDNAGRLCVYNYKFGAWTVHDLFGETVPQVVSATLTSGFYAFCTPLGRVAVQTAAWADVVLGGTTYWITSGFETGDLGPDGPIGTVKFHRAALLFRRFGDLGIQAELAADQADTFAAAKQWTSPDVAAFAGLPVATLALLPATSRQAEARSMRYRVTDTQSSAAAPTQGAAFVALVIEYAVEDGGPRVPAMQSK